MVMNVLVKHSLPLLDNVIMIHQLYSRTHTHRIKWVKPNKRYGMEKNNCRRSMANENMKSTWEIAGKHFTHCSPNQSPYGRVIRATYTQCISPTFCMCVCCECLVVVGMVMVLPLCNYTSHGSRIISYQVGS